MYLKVMKYLHDVRPIFPKSEPGQLLQKNHATAWKIQKGYHLRNGDDEKCSCCSLSKG